MNSSRVIWLATICAAIMCLAGTVQLFGINRIVVDDGRIDASTSPPATTTTLGGAIELQIRADSFRLDP